MALGAARPAAGGLIDAPGRGGPQLRRLQNSYIKLNTRRPFTPLYVGNNSLVSDCVGPVRRWTNKCREARRELRGTRDWNAKNQANGGGFGLIQE